MDGPLTEPARSVLWGLGDTAKLGRQAQEAEKASHYANAGHKPKVRTASSLRIDLKPNRWRTA